MTEVLCGLCELQKKKKSAVPASRERKRDSDVNVKRKPRPSTTNDTLVLLESEASHAAPMH
jgi:hypothetical protein